MYGNAWLCVDMCEGVWRPQVPFVYLHINEVRAQKIMVMSNKDAIRLNDLKLLLDFHTKMENNGMMGIISAKIKAIEAKTVNK